MAIVALLFLGAIFTVMVIGWLLYKLTVSWKCDLLISAGRVIVNPSGELKDE